MKCLNKLMVFFLFMLFSYGVNTFSYTYTVANMTGEDVKVGLYYELGKLGKTKVIEAYDTHKFKFPIGTWEAGFCLSKIMVSIKKIGKWGKAQKAKIGIVKDENRFEELKKSGLIGKIVEKGIKFIGLNRCQNRFFILTLDQASKKMYAFTSIDI